MVSRTTAGFLLAAALSMHSAFAQAPDGGWQACAALREDTGARLACFDAWAARQQAPAQPAAMASAAATAPASPDDDNGCHDAQSSELSRFWELDQKASCGVFGLRGYRPISLSLVTANTVNHLPTSTNPDNNASSEQPYRNAETRIQLSVRSKLAQGLLRKDGLSDSLWFGYTQQSYWQLFTPSLSRPFRSTDHEPELMYVYPLGEPGVTEGWRLRYGGLGVVHQSNGQSLPLSRSWNRVYLMAGAEDAKRRLTVQGRVWQRIPEAAATDDNPDISDYIGRAEVSAGWTSAGGHSWFFTWRSTLKQLDRGSARLQWLVPVRSPFSGTRFGDLQLHTQLFTGYGDSLLDYNKPRTVLSVGLSLFDW